MGLHNIQSDRKAIAARAFKDIDLLLLPTTTTTVPTIKDARPNAQALSAEDTIFANYFGLPAYGLINPVGILEGEEDPGEMIRWFSHPGIMTRTVEDTTLVLDVLAERKERKAGNYFYGLAKRRKLRLGVADNLRAQPDAKRAFEETVEQIRCFNYPMKSVDVPSWNPRISVPCGLDSNRLPLGLQLVAKPWDEASALQLAHQFERKIEFG